MASGMRAPRIAAWLVTLTLVAGGTWGSAQGLRLLDAAVLAEPHGQTIYMRHAHGLVVAIRHDDSFAVRLPGRRDLLWLRLAPGASVSMDHLWRHLREHAPTDIVYSLSDQGLPLAWMAD